METKKISNKQAEFYNNVKDEFQEKEAHETEVSTANNLEMLVFALHGLNVLFFLAIVDYFHLYGAFRYVAYGILLVVAGIVENLKRKRAFMYVKTVIVSEFHENDETRKNAYARSKKQAPFLFVIWAISIGVAVFSGIGMAYKFVPELAEAKQTATYYQTWEANTNALNQASKEGAGLKRIKELQALVEKAKTEYEADKKAVDKYNLENKEKHFTEISIYAVIGGCVGFILECLLFLTIWGLQKLKFEIAQSLEKEKEKAKTNKVATNIRLLVEPKPKAANF